MSWTTGRSDWINVKTDPSMTIHAVGDGVTDDTAALQQAFNLASVSHSLRLTVYLPAGTYKITSTLYWSTLFSSIQSWQGAYGLWLVGCGSNTTIQWAGAAGGVMFLDQGSSRSHYEGIVWNAGTTNKAGFGIVHDSDALYQTRMRHENEAFIGFTGNAGQGTINVPYVYTWSQGVVASNLGVGVTSIPLNSIPTNLVVGAGVTGTGMPTGAGGATTTTVTAINTSTNIITISAATNHGINAGTGLNFTSSVAGVPETVPAAGIVTGVKNGASPMAETMIWNCLFQNDTNGAIVGYEYYNNYMYIFKSCEFENCGTGLSSSAGKCVVMDTHFSGSTTADVATGLTTHLRRCTSVGSKLFFQGPFSGTATMTVIQDCWIDSWTNTKEAILFQDRTDSVTDCVFTHPPAGALGAIAAWSANPIDLTLSNNYCSVPTVPISYVPAGGNTCNLINIPSGNLGSTLTSPDQTFIQSTWATDGPTILDISQPPYNAVPNTDCTSKIQSAIYQAEMNNDGTVVYIPSRLYYVSSSLAVAEGNYKIQGTGFLSALLWTGANPTTSPIFQVTTPQNITIEQLNLEVANSSGISTQPCVTETSTGASNVVYDELTSGAYTNSPGIILTSLPANSYVYMPLCDSALTVNDCGRATIFSDYLCLNLVKVTGPTYSPTGFLGALSLEGGGGGGTTGWDISVDDNQNFVGADFYNEQSFNHLQALNTHSVSWTGQIALQGFKEESNAPSTTIGINNYGGRIFYGSQNFLNNDSTPVFTQTGTAPVDLVLVGNIPITAPTYSLGASCNLIALNNIAAGATVSYLPNVQPTGWGASAAAGLDQIRLDGNYDLNLDYGLFQGVTNTSFEADAPNPNPTTAIGYTPANWTVTNALAAGGGARNLTVVPTASPFGPGTQGLLWIDSTGSTSGSALYANQYPKTLPASDPGVWTFDFRMNSSANHSDVWIRAFAGPGNAGGIHISYNGTTAYLGANIDGHDSYVMIPLMDTWYRARIVLAAADAGPSDATLYLTPWTSTGPGATTSYTIDGITATSSAGIDRILFSSGSGPGYNQNVNFDNVTANNNLVFALP